MELLFRMSRTISFPASELATIHSNLASCGDGVVSADIGISGFRAFADEASTVICQNNHQNHPQKCSHGTPADDLG